MARKFAADDASLNTGSIIVSRNRKYSDINLLFQAKPGNGDIYLSKDAAAVKQAVKNLILTNPNEVPFSPEQGAGIRSYLFELDDQFSALEIEQAIRSNIDAFEPRAEILNITVRMSFDGHKADVTITFRVVSTEETVTVTAIVERLR